MAQAYNAAPYPGTMADKTTLEDYQCSSVVLPEGPASLQSPSIAGEA
jgi:hypothetical protein